MTLRKSLLCLLALIAVPAVSGEIVAQNNHASVTHAVEEARKAGVSEETLNRLLSLGYDNAVEAASMAGLVSITGEAAKENLPQEPFVGKIEEGFAKRIPAASIEQVLRQKKLDYMFALSLISEYQKKHGIKEKIIAKDLIGIAECLYSGLSRQDLARAFEEAPAVRLSRLRRAINLNASLKQVGFDPKFSDRIVFTGLQRNFFTAQHRDFARAILAGKRKGISDSKIAEAALSTITSGGTVAYFCSQIGIPSSDIAQYVP